MTRNKWTITVADDFINVICIKNFGEFEEGTEYRLSDTDYKEKLLELNKVFVYNKTTTGKIGIYRMIDRNQLKKYFKLK